jgi:hypothetical protein
MTSKLLILFGVIIIIAIGVFIYFNLAAPVSAINNNNVSIDIISDPVQVNDTKIILPSMTLGNAKFNFDVKARYKLNGILVSTHRYSRGFMSNLAPYDFAVCWGDKITNYLPYLKFSQVSRFCLYKYKTSSLVDINYVQKHMSNNHMIPSTLTIRKALGKGKKGELVSIEGYLVYVTASDKKLGTSNWNSSTSRDDIGNGACEIIYVTKLQLNDKVYE